MFAMKVCGLSGCAVAFGISIAGCQPSPEEEGLSTVLSDLQMAGGTSTSTTVTGTYTTAASPFWFPTSSMLQPRTGHTATLLNDGRVLVMGGGSGPYDRLRSAEYYDPGTQRWFSAGSTFFERMGNTATRLKNGNVVVAGGTSPFNNSVEMYIPSANAWFPTGPLNVARNSHSATLLNDGRILVAGGIDAVNRALASAEVYNPATQTWTLVGSLATARYFHTATLLPSGKVLVAGGANGLVPGVGGTAEIFDPATGAWSPTDILTTSRYGHSATAMANGRVVIAGGLTSDDGTHNLSLKKVEMFNPVTEAFFMITNMNTARRYHGGALLPNGKLLVTGGAENDHSGTYQQLSSTEVLDPVNMTWTPFAGMTVARTGHSTTTLLNGNVLVAGGTTPAEFASASAELFDSTVTCATVTIGPAAMPAATLGAAYNVAMVQSGSAVEPRNWQIMSGALPPGLTLNTVTGVISGTPTALGTFNFVIQASVWACSSAPTSATLVVRQRFLTYPILSGGGGTISSP